MSNTAVCFTSNERFKSVAQSFCDDEHLTLEGCVNRTSALVQYIKSLDPANIIVDSWHNWHSVLEAFVKLCQELDFLSMPRIFIFEDQGFLTIIHRVEKNVLEYLLTGRCGLCSKTEISSDRDSSQEKESISRCFSCGALDDGRGDTIAFLTLPSIHPKNSDIDICSDCLERIWGSYQRVLKRATLEYMHGSGKRKG